MSIANTQKNETSLLRVIKRTGLLSSTALLIQLILLASCLTVFSLPGQNYTLDCSRDRLLITKGNLPQGKYNIMVQIDADSSELDTDTANIIPKLYSPIPGKDCSHPLSTQNDIVSDSRFMNFTSLIKTDSSLIDRDAVYEYRRIHNFVLDSNPQCPVVIGVYRVTDDTITKSETVSVPKACVSITILVTITPTDRIGCEHGVIVGGSCICLGGYYGQQCSFASTKLSLLPAGLSQSEINNKSSRFTVTRGSMQHYHYEAATISQVSLSFVQQHFDLEVISQPYLSMVWSVMRNSVSQELCPASLYNTLDSYAPTCKNSSQSDATLINSKSVIRQQPISIFLAVGDILIVSVSYSYFPQQTYPNLITFQLALAPAPIGNNPVGEIVGIVVGSLVLMACIIFIAQFGCCCKNKLRISNAALCSETMYQMPKMPFENFCKSVCEVTQLYVQASQQHSTETSQRSYTETTTKDGHPQQTECVICLQEFAQLSIVEYTPCGHLLHQRCLREWLRKDYTCPICRSELTPIRVAVAIHTLVKNVQQRSQLHLKRVASEKLRRDFRNNALDSDTAEQADSKLLAEKIWLYHRFCGKKRIEQHNNETQDRTSWKNQLPSRLAFWL